MLENLFKLIVVSGLVISGFFVASSPTHAVDCARPISSDFTVTSDCVFAGLVDGVDEGTVSSNTAILTVQSGILTVNADQAVVFGILSLTGGSVALSGQLNVGMPIWVVDADADGYPASTTQYAQTNAPTNGRRRNLMISLTADCNDSLNTVHTNTWVCDTCYESCCDSHGYCGGTCTSSSCAQGPFANCAAPYDVWNYPYNTCYCSYCPIYENCNPYSCNCAWQCL
ncbi:hypothetical protein KKH23_03765 [Patescibacteria group bacterium]|nr:hypothetical protein [Patescibacteria group bacterium]MBU0846282.1 hypothetical protein [Patescibacteria group bacterium]MBU1066899.1 hypothetical protein [Patescibacteria group bacterium]